MDDIRKSFVFYRDWYEMLRDLDKDSKVELYDAIASVGLGYGMPELSQSSRLVMKLIESKIMRDREHWQEVSNKRKEVGRIGGLAKNKQLVAIGSNCKQKEANDTKSKQKEASVADNVNDNVSVNNDVIDNKKENLKEKKKLDLSAVSAEMLPIVEDWLEYKKEKKQSYKQRGFATFYNTLVKYSDNNPVIAHAIIEKSMGNNYSGIFPLRDDEVRTIQAPTKELTLREKCDRFLDWLCKRRGEDAMMAYKISINDFSEMYRHYNDSAKLCEAVMELTKQPIMPNEKLIDLFRRQQKGE